MNDKMNLVVNYMNSIKIQGFMDFIKTSKIHSIFKS